MIRLRSSRAKSRDDWIIDLGLEGDDKGGEIVATGTQEDVVKEARTYTRRYLALLFQSATPGFVAKTAVYAC